MPRSAINFWNSLAYLITSRLSRAISSCSGFIWPLAGKRVLRIVRKGLHRLRCRVGRIFRSSNPCAYETLQSLISRTASSLNLRANLRLSESHLRSDQTPNSVSSEPGAGQSERVKLAPMIRMLTLFQSERI